MSTTLAISPVIAVAALVAVALVGLVGMRKWVHGTTLFSPWWWCVIALAAIATSEMIVYFAHWSDVDPRTAALRYAARAALLCPTVSLIGAKRPQAAAWNFIVLSLWAMLVLPSAEAVLLNTGQPLEIHTFRTVFLAGLILITLACGLPTRRWFATLGVAAGQALLLAPFMLPTRIGTPTQLTLSGLACLTAAAVAAARTSPASAASSLDRLWLDFRDSFGLFWALRVQERLIDAAQRQQWPVTLQWSGWTTLDGQPLSSELPSEQLRPVLTSFRGLLRRFVSNEWIAERAAS